MSEGPQDPIPVQTAFFVTVDRAGVVSVHTKEIPSVTIDREASLLDLEAYASQVIRNVNRVATAQLILSALSPAPDPTPADRVADALSKRTGE